MDGVKFTTEIRQLEGKFHSKETAPIEWTNHVSPKIRITYKMS